MTSDRDIMKRVQNGESSLFSLLVHKYRLPLHQFALSKLHDQQAAEDVVQEAFLAAYHARDSYSPEFAFSTWIWTITLNLSRRDLKRAQSERTRQLHYVESQRRPLRYIVNFEEVLLKEEQIRSLDACLDQLPESQADAIRLRFFGRLSYEEVALTTGCSLSGAKRRVKLGLLKLSELAARETNPDHLL